MNDWLLDVLMQQCPFRCPSGGGANPLLLLAVLVASWFLFDWIKRLLKSKEISVMNKIMRIVIVAALIVVVGIVFVLRENSKTSGSEQAQTVTSSLDLPAGTKFELPRMVDLGSSRCVPCQMMKPILDELQQEYKDSFEVVFIDVEKSLDEAKQYSISVIPTQIFYDVSGKELFRHEGFFSKEDILGKWKELGISIEKETVNDKD